MTEANQPIQMIKCTNSVDRDGNPAGGSVSGNGIAIRWQDGPRGRAPGEIDTNGADAVQVINGVLQRLEFYQASKFGCYENDMAIGNLRLALFALNVRTRTREDRGVEGTNNL